MSQSLASVVVHIVYSTKNREPWLRDPIQDEFREICKRHDIGSDERYVWD